MGAERRGGPLGAAALVLVLSACTPASDAPAPPSSSPALGGSAEPCPTADPVAWGDVVAGARAEDERGAYCRVALDPRSDVFDVEIPPMDRESIEKWGFTEYAPEAIELTLRILVEEALDSPYLDSQAPDAAAAWFAATEYPFAYDPSVGGIILTGELPPLARDGGPRSESTELEVLRVFGQGGKTGPPTLVVRAEARSLFRLADGGVLPATTRYELSFGAAGEITGHGYHYDLGESQPAR